MKGEELSLPRTGVMQEVQRALPSDANLSTKVLRIRLKTWDTVRIDTYLYYPSILENKKNSNNENMTIVLGIDLVLYSFLSL